MPEGPGIDEADVQNDENDETDEAPETYTVTYIALAIGEDGATYEQVGQLVKELTAEDNALPLSAEDTDELLPADADGTVSYTLAPEADWFTDETLETPADTETEPAADLMLYTVVTEPDANEDADISLMDLDEPEAVPITESSVAQVGENGYDTLAEAIAAAAEADSDHTVTLLQDVTDASDITVSDTVVINGGGKTITRSAAVLDKALFNVNPGASLTLNNVNLADNGGGTYTYSLIAVNGGELYTDGVSITGIQFMGTEGDALGKSAGAISITNGATLEFENSSITGCVSAAGSAALHCGNNSTMDLINSHIDRNKNTCEDGTNSANMAIVRVYGANAKLTMTGGSISNNEHYGNGVVGILGAGSSFTLNSGSISNNAYTFKSSKAGFGSAVHVWDGSTFTMNGGEIAGNTVSGAATYPTSGLGGGKSSSTVHLNGGKIVGSDGSYALLATPSVNWEIGTGFTVEGKVGIYEGKVTNNGTIDGDVYLLEKAQALTNNGRITGKVYGEFAVQGTQPEGGYADLVATGTVDGVVTGHKTLADAVAAGGTVELLKDVSESGITVTGDVTIKAAAGVTITRKDSDTMFNVTSGSLTLDGVTIDGKKEPGISLINLEAGTGLTLTGSTIKDVYTTKEGGVIKAVGQADSHTKVNLIGNSTISGCQGSSSGLILAASTNVDTVLENVTISDNEVTNDSNHALFKQYTNCTMEIKDGTLVTKNTYHGNGMIAAWGGTKITMSGGKIIDNLCTYVSTSPNHFGSPIHLWSGCSFTMTGGEISGNRHTGTFPYDWLTGCIGSGQSNVTVDLQSGIISSGEGMQYALMVHGGEWTIGNGVTINGDVAAHYSKLTNKGTINGSAHLLSMENTDGAGGEIVNEGVITGDIQLYTEDRGGTGNTGKFTNSGTVQGKAITKNHAAVQGVQPLGGYDDPIVALVIDSAGNYTSYDNLDEARAKVKENSGSLLVLLKDVPDEGTAGSSAVSAETMVHEPKVKRTDNSGQSLTGMQADLGDNALKKAQELKESLTVQEGLDKLGTSASSAKAVYFHVVTEVEMKAQPYTAGGALTVDITPHYTVYASNSSTSYEESNIVEEGDLTTPAETQGTKVTIPLPSDLASEKLVRVEHVHGGLTHYFTLPVEGGQISFVNNNGFSTFVVTAASGIALDSISTSAGSLSPAFDPEVTSYTVNVGNGTTSMTFGLGAMTGATVTVNGAVIAGGSYTASSLAVGNNVYRIRVEYNGNAKEYTVTVVRAQAPASSSGTTTVAAPATTTRRPARTAADTAQTADADAVITENDTPLAAAPAAPTEPEAGLDIEPDETPLAGLPELPAKDWGWLHLLLALLGLGCVSGVAVYRKKRQEERYGL